MTTINTLLEAFREQFVRDDGLMNKYTFDKEEGYEISTADAVELFFRTSFTKYNSELATKIEGMKKSPVHKYNCHHIEPCIERENELVNDSLDDVLALLKEGNV